jgi:hypothetical protein
MSSYLIAITPSPDLAGCEAVPGSIRAHQRAGRIKSFLDYKDVSATPSFRHPVAREGLQTLHPCNLDIGSPLVPQRVCRKDVILALAEVSL